MRERLTVKEVKINNSQIHLQLEPPTRLTEMTATGQMLVDSDTLSFVYVVERANDYTYIIISEHHWPLLSEGLKQDQPFLLTDGDTTLELLQFKEELAYLVDNIKGNSNYGDEMVTKVESTFL